MSEEKEKSKKVYNIVDSVKGGSGKTTFALMLSLLLDKELTKSRKNNNETSVCLIDMDIQGSALLYLLYGRSYLDGEKDKEKAEKIAYLNDRVITVGEESGNERNYIKPFFFKNKETCGPRTDVIFCDPRTDSKKKFRSMSNQNYSPEVLYSTYRMGLGNMLSNLEGIKEYLHKHVVFDMPPNADGYSDAVYDVMLKNEYSVMEKDDRCNLFLLSTLDMGQRSSTLDYFFELASSENFQKINKIFFVFNDWCGFKKLSTKEDTANLFSETVSYMKTEISKVSIKCEDKVQEKIFFVGLKFNVSYYRQCTQRDGIQNIEEPEGLSDPVEYLADMNTDVNNMENTGNTVRLLKLLDSKEK